MCVIGKDYFHSFFRRSIVYTSERDLWRCSFNSNGARHSISCCVGFIMFTRFRGGFNASFEFISRPWQRESKGFVELIFPFSLLFISQYNRCMFDVCIYVSHALMIIRTTAGLPAIIDWHRACVCRHCLGLLKLIIVYNKLRTMKRFAKKFLSFYY